jgi:hypothetical protein
VLTYDGTWLHSSGAHVVRAKSFVAAGEALETFRLKCTNSASPVLVRLDLANSAATSTFLNSVSAQCTKIFGPPSAVGKSAGALTNWFLSEAQLSSALEIMDRLNQIPADKHGFGVLSLSYKLEFAFRSAATGEVLPFQSQQDYLNWEGDYERFLGRSVLTVDLSAHSHASAFFSFPFEEWSSEAAHLAWFIQSALPFRISEKRWKRWSLTKSGQSYVGRKVAVSFPRDRSKPDPTNASTRRAKARARDA